jgi:hypothetical protein
MPLENRVTPCGEILALATRGTFMGNRGGALHNQKREIVRQYASRRWITCLLEFKGRHRTVMSPGRYTELFFLDEAVALAAGHRPCAECRRERFNAFKAAWRPEPMADFLYADDIDWELHRARIRGHREKVTYPADSKSLPDGCFVQIADASYLVWREGLLRWSPEAYVEKHSRSGRGDVTVLTPEPIVRCLRHGYRPEIHPSALAL